jgi:molybdopterin synthase sulfur carrier subunit
MAVKVVIPTPLRQYAGKNDSVVVEGNTVDEIMRNLMSRYGELQKHLYTDDGKLRSFVNIYRNDEDIRYLQREQTPVKDSDVLSIVPSIAGGSCAKTSIRAAIWARGEAAPASERPQGER